MRVGIIADIHGNLLALDAVLGELGRDGVDEIVCLGDVASLGPEPRAVLARLAALSCPVVMGNTDAWLLKPPPAGEAGLAGRPLRVLNAWCAAQLSDRERAAVAALPRRVERTLGAAGRRLLAVHGSPRSFDDVIVAATPAEEVDAMLGGEVAAVVAGGHTHVQMLRRHRDMHLLNPGSVGLPGTGASAPFNRAPRWAEYALLEAAGERLRITCCRTPLDVEAMIARARACRMPEIAWWAGLWGHPPGVGPRPAGA